jgi:hypothetical protein
MQLNNLWWLHLHPFKKLQPGHFGGLQMQIAHKVPAWGWLQVDHTQTVPLENLFVRMSLFAVEADKALLLAFWLAHQQFECA